MHADRHTGRVPLVEARTEAPAAESPALSSIHVRNLSFTLLAVATVILLLQFMQPVLIPFVVAGLLFYALDPAVDGLQAIHVPRAIGAALVLFVVVGVCGGLTYGLRGQALTVVERVPMVAQKIARSMRRSSSSEPTAVQKVQQAAEALQQSADPAPARPGVTRVQVENQSQSANLLWTGSMGVLSMANQALMVLFLTYFMLLSDELFKRKLVQMVGTISQKKLTLSVLDDIARQIERFLFIQIATSALVAVVTGIALWTLGLEQAAFWGVIAGVLNSIPYYGPLLVTAGLSVVAFMQFGTLSMAAIAGGTALVITSLEGFLLTPMLVGQASSMNQIAVFAGLLFWSWLWGVWGILLAVPMMMVTKVICDHVEALQPIGHLLGD